MQLPSGGVVGDLKRITGTEVSAPGLETTPTTKLGQVGGYMSGVFDPPPVVRVCRLSQSGFFLRKFSPQRRAGCHGRVWGIFDPSGGSGFWVG